MSTVIDWKCMSWCVSVVWSFACCVYIDYILYIATFVISLHIKTASPFKGSLPVIFLQVFIRIFSTSNDPNWFEQLHIDKVYQVAINPWYIGNGWLTLYPWAIAVAKCLFVVFWGGGLSGTTRNPGVRCWNHSDCQHLRGKIDEASIFWGGDSDWPRWICISESVSGKRW